MSDSPVSCDGVWHDAHPMSLELGGALAHVVVLDVAHRGHRQRAAVERHVGQPFVGELRLAAVDRVGARVLGRAALLLGMHRRRDADVADERAGHLLLDRRDVRLPPEPAEHGRSGLVRPTPCSAARRSRRRPRRRDRRRRGSRPPGSPRAGPCRSPAAPGAARASRRRASGPNCGSSTEYVGRASVYGVPSAYSPSMTPSCTPTAPRRGRRGSPGPATGRRTSGRAAVRRSSDSPGTEIRSSSPIGTVEPSRRRRHAAPVEDVARRARLGVEHRAQPVTGIGRRRARSPSSS